jgi:YHS domain-containing protein
MVKNITVILAGIMLVFGMNILSFGMERGDISGGQDSAAQATEVKSSNNQAAVAILQASAKKAVDVGNKICPVTGEKIDEKTKAIIEYNGKVYNLCCAMCIDEFNKDPEKYIKKINEELKTPSQDEHTTSHH